MHVDCVHGAHADRDGRVAGLGGIERLTRLKDDTWLELGVVQNVSTIYWEGIDLFASNNARDANLLGINLEGAGTDFYGLSRRSQGQLEAARCRGTGTHNRVNRELLKARTGNRHCVIARNEGTDAVKPSPVGDNRLRRTRVGVKNRNVRTRHHSSRWIRDASLNQTHRSPMWLVRS